MAEQGVTDNRELDAGMRELRELKRENRELKKYLLSVSTVVAQSIAVLDVTMKQPSTVERGKQIAAVCNTLEYVNDSMMHFGLKIDFDKMKRLKKKWEIFKSDRSLETKCK